jgi:hypothetical protein
MPLGLVRHPFTISLHFESASASKQGVPLLSHDQMPADLNRRLQELFLAELDYTPLQVLVV